MKTGKALTILLLVLLIFLTAVGIWFGTKICSMDYNSSVYRESVQELNNPYIGWYEIYGYCLSDDESFDASQLPVNPGPGLALLQINLRNYARSPVSSAGLEHLNAILDAWQSTGRQLILRFLYDWDGSARKTEPDTLSLLLTHMSQTAEIVNAYEDCIYILQGIFVGNWGEMHGSDYMTETDMLTLAGHLSSVTAPGIFLSVRTPEQWRAVTASPTPLAPENAFDGSLAARLGLFNDGMLGSETDLGTYGAADAPPSLLGKRPRQEELLFQESLCRYVPNGGETVGNDPCSDLLPAVEDLARSHVSYLNSAYDENVFSKWREQIWQGADPFDGMNGYDYISRHLGYRYCVRSSALTFSPPWSETACFSAVLENVGFSNSYRNFRVSLVLRHAKSGADYVYSFPTDTRFWDSGTEILLETSFPVQDLPPGTYELFLKINDPVSGQPVLLANEGSDDENGCRLGSLTIGRNLLKEALRRIRRQSL